MQAIASSRRRHCWTNSSRKVISLPHQHDGKLPPQNRRRQHCLGHARNMNMNSLPVTIGIVLIVLVGLVACGCGNSVRQEEQVARELLKSVLAFCQEDDGTVRPVEAISAMAAVVGERCIDAAGEFKVRGHSFIPGQRVFSDKVNTLLCGDNGSIQLSDIPAKSVYGILRDRLAGSVYEHHFPSIEEVFSGFAARIGKPEDWGKVPVSLPEEQRPRRLPLRIAFDSRSRVDEILKAVSGDKIKCLRISTIALNMLLVDSGLQVEPTVALTLAFETANGMAKTAPMKDEAIESPSEAMREAQHRVIKMGHK